MSNVIMKLTAAIKPTFNRCIVDHSELWVALAVELSVGLHVDVTSPARLFRAEREICGQ